MGRFGYRDITDGTFLDLSTGVPAIFMNYLKVASQAYGQETVYSHGARGNPKRVGFKSGNAMKMDFETEVLSPEILAMLFGTTITTGVSNVPVTQVITTLTNTITLGATAIIGTTTPITVSPTTDLSTASGAALTKVASAPTAGQYSISTNTITLNSTEYAAGGNFLITYYKATSSTSKQVKFQADKFVKAYKFTGYTLWKDEQTDLNVPCFLTVPKLQLEIDGVTLNSIISGDPTSLKFSGEALKIGNNSDLIIFDIDEGSSV